VARLAGRARTAAQGRARGAQDDRLGIRQKFGAKTPDGLIRCKSSTTRRSKPLREAVRDYATMAYAGACASAQIESVEGINGAI
jgi:hypothetical protein